MLLQSHSFEIIKKDNNNGVIFQLYLGRMVKDEGPLICVLYVQEQFSEASIIL